VWLVAGALVGLVVVFAAINRLARPTAVTVPPDAEPIDTAASIPTQPGNRKTSPADSSISVKPAPSEVKTPVAEQPSVPPATGAQSRRYSRMWVNVRRGRNPSARVIRVLKPGEAVLVDSLRQGWYRVLIDGRKVGYVYRSYLDTVPPHPHR
jgi:uncharacterized protein YgiM (DUF1202 family)